MSRKHFSEEEKLKMVLAVLRNERSKAELCRKHGLSPGRFTEWQLHFLRSMKSILRHPQRSRSVSALSAVERENMKLRRTIAEREHDIIVLRQLLLYR